MILSEQAKVDAFAAMLIDGEVFIQDGEVIDRSRLTISETGKQPTTRNTVYLKEDARRVRRPSDIRISPTPLKPGDKFATVFEMKEYVWEALQPEPRRIVHRYKTAATAIADAKIINQMKDTRAVVIAYEGESDYIEPGYRDTHTIWPEKKENSVEKE